MGESSGVTLRVIMDARGERLLPRAILQARIRVIDEVDPASGPGFSQLTSQFVMSV